MTASICAEIPIKSSRFKNIGRDIIDRNVDSKLPGRVVKALPGNLKKSCIYHFGRNKDVALPDYKLRQNGKPSGKWLLGGELVGQTRQFFLLRQVAIKYRLKSATYFF